MLNKITQIALISSCLIGIAAEAKPKKVNTPKVVPTSNWSARVGYQHNFYQNNNTLILYNSDEDVTVRSQDSISGSFNGVMLGVDYRDAIDKKLFWGVGFDVAKNFGDINYDFSSGTNVRYKIQNEYSIKPALVLGKSFNEFSLFTKLGVNFTSMKVEKDFYEVDNFAAKKKKKLFIGPMIGVGGEFNVQDNTSVFAEYNYTYFAKKSLHFINSEPYSTRLDKSQMNESSFMLGLKFAL